MDLLTTIFVTFFAGMISEKLFRETDFGRFTWKKKDI